MVEGLHIDDDGKLIVLQFKNNIGTVDLAQLKEEFNRILDKKPERVEIDLSEVELLSSSVISRMLSFKNHAKDFRIEVKLTKIKPRLQEMFSKLMLDQLFEI